MATYSQHQHSDMSSGLPQIANISSNSLVSQKPASTSSISKPVVIPAHPKMLPPQRQHQNHNRQREQDELNINFNQCTGFVEDKDELSPLPEDFSHLLSNSPHQYSPPTRHRSQTIDGTSGQFKKYQRTKSNPISACKLSTIPKDPIQPKCGSIGDIHSNTSKTNSGNEDSEEDDFFSELPPMRSRSQTCPESTLHKRKLKARSLRRPSTPPPADIFNGCDQNTVVEKLTISKNIAQEIDRMINFDVT